MSFTRKPSSEGPSTEVFLIKPILFFSHVCVDNRFLQTKLIQELFGIPP